MKDSTSISPDQVFGIFNDSFPPIIDGVTLTVQNYARWLGVYGKTPCVVTPWNPSAFDTDYRVLRYFSLPIVNRRPYRYGYPRLDPFIWKRLDKTPFRLVHSHCPFSSGHLAQYVKRRQGVPLIGTFHSKYRSDLEHSFRHFPSFVKPIMKRIVDFFNSCDEVWIPQAQVEETVREYGYRGLLTVVDNGNDLASLVSGEDLWRFKHEARARIGIPEGVVSLVFVGQHIWEKGVRVILESLRILDGKLPFVMNFIGTGYASADMEALIREFSLEGKVFLRGIVDDRRRLADWYAAADLFLFPSMYDNAPLVVREAAAMGTPAMLPVGSTASGVVSDGVNGFLVDRSAEAYAAAIKSLAGDRDNLRRVANGARSTLVRSWEDVVGEVSDRYDTLIRLAR